MKYSDRYTKNPMLRFKSSIQGLRHLLDFHIRRNSVLWILSIVSMTIGGMIYVLWRPTSLKMFSWFSALGIDQIVANMRAYVAPLSGFLPEWIYFSLPQAMWLFSGCISVHSIWKDYRCWQEQLWMVVVLSLALGAELGQAAGIINGVFDILDLVLISVSFLMAQTIILYKRS